MRSLLLMTSSIIFCMLLSAQLAFCQETITDKKILSSFAKIIRTKQYICQPCNQVSPTGHNADGISYEVICNYDLTYTVVLTPRSDMIVQPVSSY